MQPSFSRVWKEIGVPKWTWDTRTILMVPKQRPSLVMARNASGHPLSATGLAITRINKDDVPAALDKYLSGNGVTGARKKALAGELWPAIVQEMSAGGVLLSVDAKKIGTAWLYAGKVK